MAETLEIFQERVNENANYISDNSPQFDDYYSTRIVPLLRQNIGICLMIERQHHLTNNCKSLNHAIKHLPFTNRSQFIALENTNI